MAILNEVQIEFDVLGIDLEVYCHFEFTEGTPGHTSGLPEDCFPEEPNEYALMKLLVDEGEELPPVDISELLKIDSVHDAIVEQLEAERA